MRYFAFSLLSLLEFALYLLSTVLIVYPLLTWFVSPDSRFMRVLQAITEPFVRIFRPLAAKLALRFGIRLDFSYFFAAIAVNLLYRILYWLLVRF